MKKLLAAIFIIFIASCQVWANVYDYPLSLEYISERLPKLESIRCTFKQEKYLNNIQKPIVSGGDFEFIKDDGVYFNTKYPVQTKTNYTNKNYQQINAIIKAISSKRYSKIEKEFQFYYEGNLSDWTFGLRPQKTSASFDYISTITVSGKDYINKIEIVQTNGNRTVIWFKK